MSEVTLCKKVALQVGRGRSLVLALFARDLMAWGAAVLISKFGTHKTVNARFWL